MVLALSKLTSTTKVIEDLLATGGVAVVDLSESTSALHEQSFRIARRAFLSTDEGEGEGEKASSCCRRIKIDEDPAHVTGYHPASAIDGLSRYNTYRKGFVFSDGNMVEVDGVPEFSSKMSTLFTSLHSIALEILGQMEVNWELPQGWFQNNIGPTATSSQWHIKQYVLPPKDDEAEEKCWLPLHTDPSLISVVIHDVPGKKEGAMGLQYQVPSSDKSKHNNLWIDVPFHGHQVATIFVGSVLSYMTGGRIKSARHRVVVPPSNNYKNDTDKKRVVATLFLRPRGSAPLVVPPSPLFENVVLRRNNTFQEWSSRVSRNYTRKKKKKKENKDR